LLFHKILNVLNKETVLTMVLTAFMLVLAIVYHFLIVSGPHKKEVSDC